MATPQCEASPIASCVVRPAEYPPDCARMVGQPETMLTVDRKIAVTPRIPAQAIQEIDSRQMISNQ